MFSTSELQWMRKTQTDHMMDTCVIYRVASRVKNTRGETVKTFAEGVESICGLQMDPRPREIGENLVQENIDAVLRLPLGTALEPEDEIEIVKRFSEDCVPRRYEVQRYTNDGPSGCRAWLKARNV